MTDQLFESVVEAEDDDWWDGPADEPLELIDDGPAPALEPDATPGTLFDAEEFRHWREWWIDMPAFDSQNEKPYDTMTVQFSNARDRRAFLEYMGEDPARRRSIWYPSKEVQFVSERNAPDVVVEPNKYPVYVISKGRSETRLTVNHLQQLGIPFRLVVEEAEEEEYGRHVDRDTLLVLPFSNLGQGSIPARNFVWDHATKLGAKRHWILDDNINGFYKLNNNVKTKVVRENPFIAAEDWVDRYENVPIAALNYSFFAPNLERNPPMRLNRRCYSCILLSNEVDYRWRGRYNEDTDLSIRILKDGHCSALFNHMLIMKIPTMKMSGGNTDELYRQDEEFDGRLAMAESLEEQHPDIVRVIRRWDRWQHYVDYRPFEKNKLIPTPEWEARMLEYQRSST